MVFPGLLASPKSGKHQVGDTAFGSAKQTKLILMGGIMLILFRKKIFSQRLNNGNEKSIWVNLKLRTKRRRS